MPFIEPHKSIGNVRVGSKHTIIFSFTDTIKVTYVKTSCGCSLAEADNVNHQIKITYKAQPLSIQIIREGKKSQAIAKQVRVLFEDTTTPGLQHEETLTFKAIVFQ